MAGKRHRSPSWYDRARMLLVLADEVIRIIRSLRGL
jgi:hypothetical protein